MGNSELKRKQATKHNMLRVEIEAYKEHEIKFPAPKRIRTHYSKSKKHENLATVMMLGIGIP
jgi:hypothetical protein